MKTAYRFIYEGPDSETNGDCILTSQFQKLKSGAENVADVVL
jgi:hypothetical protein